MPEHVDALDSKAQHSEAPPMNDVHEPEPRPKFESCPSDLTIETQ